ncbi:ANM_HP_G0242890.mRNA.1.CDS.1 [Saccharomyces cerevisiae]|nr:ANM_HP_G0242890.mRNA.1.CDS.1 [Saccharomyces cerevisiae]CAI7002503.1 ANM_HP_G0242890.mRNA.1.CDS.1 [Saccharomyces cerevisiae]
MVPLTHKSNMKYEFVVKIPSSIQKIELYIVKPQIPSDGIITAVMKGRTNRKQPMAIKSPSGRVP